MAASTTPTPATDASVAPTAAAGTRPRLHGAARLEQVLHERRLPLVDGLRAIAVFVVVTHHFDESLMPGAHGVTFFLVLSGFLITRLLRAEWQRNGEIGIVSFYLRRMFRTFPAYYVCVLCAFAALVALHRPLTLGYVLAALTFNIDYFTALTAHFPSLIGQTWSLSVQEKFYFLWPPALALLLSRGRWTPMVGLAAAIAVIAAWRAVAIHLDGGMNYTYFAFDTRADALGWGCLVALAIEERAVRSAVPRLVALPWFPLLTVGVMLLLPPYDAGPSMRVFPVTVEPILMAVLILQLLQLADRWPWRWLDHPVPRYLGTIAYSVYLYHFFVLWGVKQAMGGAPALVRYVATILLVIGAASASYLIVERPFMKLKKSVVARPKGAAQRAVAA